jgi:hypothetical protein
MSGHQRTGSRHPQHDRAAVCVIAQQYSSSDFFSLRFLSRAVKLDTFKSALICLISYFFAFA